MKLSWVIANTAVIDPTVNLDSLKNIGPFWGGWRTWRSYQTDNVICHAADEAKNLITRQFHTKCNLHVPTDLWNELDRPMGVKLYGGEFNEMVDQPDDIVSIHLAAAHSDIVLLVGFDLSARNLEHDRLAKHRWHNNVQYLLHIFKSNPDIQWVVLDHSGSVEKQFESVPNLLFDTMRNVLTQFQ
jgi:hypothetical protein